MRMNARIAIIVSFILVFASALFAPHQASGIGGQFGLEFAIDAPWRIEPIPVPGGGYTYGPIPIVIAFHDAIFDHHRSIIKELAIDSIHVGSLKGIQVRDRSDLLGPNDPIIQIPLTQLREIERKRWVSTKQNEPAHELCRPYAGQDCRSLYDITDTHEWHAMFWYTPPRPVTPGRNIHLEVTVSTERGGNTRRWTNTLVVHAGEAPLPRLSKDWLYGDLHYHSQMTDNENESAYSYRNVVRVLGAMGLDFVFATEHASDGEQVDGHIVVWRCGSLAGSQCVPGSISPQCQGQNNCRLFEGNEARDLNSSRFVEAKRILYGPDGANEAVARDAETGGIANLRSRGLLPQIFIGEEVDAWPEMSADEQRQGLIHFGDGLQYKWPDPNGCVGKKGLDPCRAIYSQPYAPNDHRSFLVRDEQGIPIEETIEEKFTETWATVIKWVTPDKTDPLPSRQHLVYMPFSASGGTGNVRDHRGWVSSSTGKYGGASRRLEEVVREIESQGVAFLAHPLISTGPGGPGPDIVPYSRTALDRAWRSPAVLGLQFWNEDDRYKSSPTREQPTIVSEYQGEYRYKLPWHSSSAGPWKWQYYQNRGDVAHKLYHGGYTWDVYLRKGLDTTQTQTLPWLPAGEPRKWFMAGGSDAHGDLNYRRHGRPCEGQWCDAPVGDTAIGKPRNLVLVGPPQGAPAPGLQNIRRHTNQQVIDALRGGRFSVTDGPAVHIVVDRNRNGLIDDADFQMGSTFHLFPGEHVPLLVSWISTPEFGRVRTIDVYVGVAERTYGPPSPGPSPRQRSPNAYASDPASVLRITIPTANQENGYGGVAKLYLSPLQFDLIRQNGRLFYVRAYAETFSRDIYQNTSGPGALPPWTDCREGRNDPGSCGDRFAFSNPIWGRFVAACPKRGQSSTTLGIDADGNGIPDTCEREIPDPCPQATKSGIIRPSDVMAPGIGQAPATVDPGAPGSGTTGQAVKPSPRNSCQLVVFRPPVPPGAVVTGVPPAQVGPSDSPTPSPPVSGISGGLIKPRSVEREETEKPGEPVPAPGR